MSWSEVIVFLRWQALGQLMTMFAILGGVYYLSALYDAPSRNPAVSYSVRVYVCMCGEGGKGWGVEGVWCDIGKHT